MKVLREPIIGWPKLIFFAGALIGASSAFADAEQTLCNDGEDIYFSCPLGAGKIASVCASKNEGPGSGYVQYRFGKKDALEMTFPKKEEPPANKIFYVNATEGSMDRYILKFSVGQYKYFVYQSFVSGLLVKKGGVAVFDKKCETGQYAAVSYKAIKGVPTKKKSSEDW